MKKIEIIGNIVLLQELLDNVQLNFPHMHYTVLPAIKAKGKKGQANGDEIWPDTNFVFISYLEKEDYADKLASICKKIKKHSTENGLKIYLSDNEYRAL